MSFWRWNAVDNGLDKCQVAWFDIGLIWNCEVFVNKCELRSGLNAPFNISTHKKCFGILQKLRRPVFNCRIPLCWLSSGLGQKRISECDTRQERAAKVLMTMSACFDAGCSIVVCNCVSNDESKEPEVLVISQDCREANYKWSMITFFQLNPSDVPSPSFIEDWVRSANPTQYMRMVSE